MSFSTQKIFCICGHYGVGKTNVSVSLAEALHAAGREHVTLLDFDIVNPYFRSADNAEQLRRAGIEVILPDYANTNVDIPVLPPQVARVFEVPTTAVFDVGGDDSGAIALKGFSARIKDAGYELYVVINQCRMYISEPEEAVAMVRAIEASSALTATGIINNTNLGAETTPDLLRASAEYARRVCELTGLPLIATTCFPEIAADFTPAERETLRLSSIRDATRKIF